MFKGILCIMAVFLSVSICLPAWPGEPGGPQPAESSSFDTQGERIGGLRLGMHQKEVDKIIPCKVKKGKEALEGATGSYVQMWQYPDCGIELKMGSDRKGGAKTVESIAVTSPSDLATNRGIRIGSTEAEVMKDYGPYRDNEMSENGEEFVAGSIYDGMIFQFKNGQVTRIFLGAAAE